MDFKMENLDKFNALCRQIINEMSENQTSDCKDAFVSSADKVCKNWGYLNDMPNDKEKSDAFMKAQEMHEQMEKNDPEHHKLVEYPSRWGTGATYECKCGFSYKVDSSRIIFNFILISKRRNSSAFFYYYELHKW